MVKQYASLVACILSLVILSAPVIGCSSRKTTTTTTTQEVPVAAPAQGTPQAAVVTEKTETTTESSSGIGCSGILTCTVEGIGFILSLPFRLIVGLFDVIF